MSYGKKVLFGAITTPVIVLGSILLAPVFENLQNCLQIRKVVYKTAGEVTRRYYFPGRYNGFARVWCVLRVAHIEMFTISARDDICVESH